MSDRIDPSSPSRNGGSDIVLVLRIPDFRLRLPWSSKGADSRRSTSRRWNAPEVVQTSTMDCGPAALKCLLEGHRIPVSYGRLREACQTDVDGTSIDAIEDVSNTLGLHADQVMIPVEHVLLDRTNLPALVVVRHADGGTHFVVAWRRVGRWIQIMDPALGRRWVSCDRFAQNLVRHDTSAPAAQWREWGGTEEFLAPLRHRLRRLGAGRATSRQLVTTALMDAGWFTLGALDASTRLVSVVVEQGGIRRGAEAVRMLGALFQRTCSHSHDIFTIIPPAYWSVSPDPRSVSGLQQRLTLRGAVLMRVAGRRPGVTAGASAEADSHLSPELSAALREQPSRPVRALMGFFRLDGLLSPLALAGAAAVAAVTAIVEALLFRGIFDIGPLLAQGEQRLIGVALVVAFMALALVIRLPLVSESQRMGRRLDTRLRMALLRKLPHLTDRYFQSRPISDLAERNHTLHLMRLVPGLGLHFLQTAIELLLTLGGLALIDPRSALWACGIAGIALVLPAVFQPALGERDLRVRNHAGALNRFYLDALLGLVPIRTHRAQAAVRHQHQSLLVEWVRASVRVVRLSLVATGLQALLSSGLTAALLIEHFLRTRAVTGGDLLLAYWALKLPSLGQTLTSLAHQYPSQRNILLRLLEPLSAPERTTTARAASPGGTLGLAAPLARAPEPPRGDHRGVSIRVDGGAVVAAGHAILRDLDLQIAPGEHVAIVGRSGAGKSSLLGLLLGWHRLAEGHVRIDGAEPTEARLVALRQATAWVDPSVQLWNTAFLDNLAYSAKDPEWARLAAAIEDAELRPVLRSLPHGLQTPLGEGGARLSGGEGQRVRLGRALVQSDVRLALLDEPFRGLDRTRRSTLLAAARAHWRHATLLCVTHDIGDTVNFDRVLVIEHGRIIEDGRPATLRQQDSRYRDLLAAETRVRERLWRGPQWRRVRVDQGLVTTPTVERADFVPGEAG